MTLTESPIFDDLTLRITGAHWDDTPTCESDPRPAAARLVCRHCGRSTLACRHHTDLLTVSPTVTCNGCRFTAAPSKLIRVVAL